MGALAYAKFLKRFGIHSLFVSTPNIVPGAIIEKKKHGYYAVGHLRDILGDSWATVVQPANLVYGTIERKLSLRGRVTLSQFGISIGGGLEKAKSVTFLITGVKARIFTKASWLTIHPEVVKLRRTNPKLWKMIDNKWVADHTYYATEFTLEFDVAAGIDLKAEVTDRIAVSGNVNVTWKTKSRLTITDNDVVPFGFTGWQI